VCVCVYVRSDSEKLYKTDMSLVVDQRLSYQTRKGIAAMQKSFEHRNMEEVRVRVSVSVSVGARTLTLNPTPQPYP